MTYKVLGTVRLVPCDRNSRITHLVLDKAFKGFTVHPLGPDLAALSDLGQLIVDLPGAWPPTVKVLVYYAGGFLGWIAKTEADSTVRNNLDNLPIYRANAAGTYSTEFIACGF